MTQFIAIVEPNVSSEQEGAATSKQWPLVEIVFRKYARQPSSECDPIHRLVCRSFPAEGGLRIEHSRNAGPVLSRRLTQVTC
ncbi:MAG: hypothetical protein AVDCRST_MAG23-2668 [uncultured Sphingosinicella sp.]|uniref:Uncharacterized protein n=1 Tax=uncultured Sphingosinicella sp. TaxID=478748 RepID=A0A6J4UEZ6_9SPHN|nr:MAG: hypothetical protein AVDCRST_MAG23-2668 [uncultured Sphingosinicella sp.]